MSTLNGDHSPTATSYDKQREAEFGNGAGEHDNKAAYGPGPADPYTQHHADGTPVVAEDELRIAGVKRIEAISAQLGPKARALMFFGCFLVAYAYGLDGANRYYYQSYATNEFQLNSLITTISVVRSVIGAAAQPAGGKIADVFGRMELLIVSIIFYTIGSIIEAVSKNLETFSAGAVFYELGYTMAQLLIEVIIADLSSLRTRVFFSFVPAMPFLINSWISPFVLDAAVGSLGERAWFWRWAIGMWAIIYPASSLLLLGVLYHAQRKAKRSGALVGYASPFQKRGMRIFVDLFWQCDVVGILLIIIALGFFLTPFTLAGGTLDPSGTWATAKILAPLIIGIVFFPVLFFWEKLCKYPLIPFYLLKDRGVWAGFLIAMTLNAAWYMQFTFAQNVLIIAFNQTTRNLAFIQNVYSFVSTCTGILVGLAVMRVRRLKPFICFGACLFMVAFGLLVRFRGSADASTKELAGYIAAEVVLGMGAGFFSYPTQAAVQARTKHERVAVVTGLYLASFRVGNAIGSAISGAVWTQRMLPTLTRYLDDPAVATRFYLEPLVVVLDYPIGTAERTGAIEAYREVAKILSIIGICLSALIIVWAFLLKDPKLGNTQSLDDAEEESINSVEKEDYSGMPVWKRIWHKLA